MILLKGFTIYSLLLMCMHGVCTVFSSEQDACNDRTPDMMPLIPPSCYSPHGNDCKFYTECLESKYPCQKEGKVSYAVDYGHKFCMLFSEASHKFSTAGRKWINAVRKCLQDKLVPLLHPSQQPTCPDILTKAFETHAGCYVEPGNGAPSVCDLSWKDRMQLFWVVKGNSLDSTSFIPTIKQIFHVAFACGRNV